MKKKVISFALVLTLVFGLFAGVIPARVFAVQDENSVLIEGSDIPLHLYYDEEASHGINTAFENQSASSGSSSNWIDANVNDDWERWSIPLGNGYFGANVFGRTETERIQLTEKTLANPYRINNNSSLPTDGLNNFSETYIDFGHTNSAVTDYSRELDLKTAVSTVSYVYNGVTYTREYFTSYPDNAMVIRLDASVDGKLDFVLRPTVPYEQEYMAVANDHGGKTGEVTSSVSDGVGTVELSGKMEYFDIDFYGLYKVYANGGTVSATTCTNADGDTDGTITVSGANSAYIVITLGTDYVLSEEVFTSSGRENKPTFSTGLADAIAKVQGYMNSLDTVTAGQSYEEKYATLKSRHLEDYQGLFGRVTLDLGCKQSDFTKTTDLLLAEYQNGSGSTYLEALYFQYGRYLLIASSRSGALPANLQGTWNRYNNAPWSSGYWHNVNVQMNYWPAFSTNLAETFEAYVEYNNAYMTKAEQNATGKINSLNPTASGKDGGNGWCIDTGAYPFDVNPSSSIGNLGFTTQLFWEYYEYTQDENILRSVVYPVLVSAARFITKAVYEDENGNYLAISSDSPEQYVNGVWYYTDKGTAYAQSFAYQNNYNTLLAARELGINFDDEGGEDYAILKTVMNQLDKYNPIIVGLSGQVKEFFEEDYYGDLGEKTHRHISQLVGLYPGNIINGTTPAWLDAAIYTLTERGDNATGWGVAHRMNLWARTKDGDRTYDLVQQILKVNTATNLWDLHPPFQIDGNLGGTAGIAEMLLQSHEGYIEPLAAIPTEWSTGSYTGLVARGDFEVSAKWADGLATTFNIKSLKGGTVQVKYPGISGCNLFTAGGNSVGFTVVDKDIIEFNTTAGETYIISNFTSQDTPEKVTGLSVETEALGNSTITWNASSDANTYKVYVAKESQADYTLLTTTTATSYTFTPQVGEENLRYTFRVCAVSPTGTEGKGAVCYRNPSEDVKAKVDGISANVVSGSLQVAVKSNSYANKYKLWSRVNQVSDWVLVKESAYPIIIDEAYNSDLKYGVSVVSLLGEESEVTAISQYNQSFETVNYQPSNILLGQKVTSSAQGEKDVHAKGYGYETLTDGKLDNTGRFSTATSDSKTFEATISLPSDALLGELRIWDFDPWVTAANYVGTSLTIELMYEGEWTTVVQCASNAEILSHRQDISGVGKFLSFDLSGNRAQAIRITIPTPVSGKSISIYEIQCTGAVLPNGRIYEDNLLLGKTPVVTPKTLTHVAEGTIADITDGTYRYSENAKYWRTYYNFTDMEFDAAFMFAGEARLNTLRIYDYNGETNWANAAGPQIIIQVFVNGVWTTVEDVTITGGAGNNIEQYRAYGYVNGSSSKEFWLQFDLGLVKAEGIRIYMPSKASGNFGMYEIECDGFLKEDGSQYSSNLLAGKTFIPSTGTIWTSNGGYENLTDGSLDTNSRVGVNAANGGIVTITTSFGDKLAKLSGLQVYFDINDVKRCGASIQIQVYRGGEWKTLVDHTHTEGVLSEVFFLGGIEAEKLRIIIPEKFADGGDTVVLREIMCDGTLIDYSGAKISENVFEGYTFVPTEAAAAKVWQPNTYDKLTDGVTGSDSYRFASSGTDSFADATLSFGDYVATLDTLIVDYGTYAKVRSGTGIQIDVLFGGVWTTVINETYTQAYQGEKTFDLGGVQAQAVRLYVPGVYTSTYGSLEAGDCIVIQEMYCSGVLTPITGKTWKDNVFKDNKFVPTAEALAVMGSDVSYDNITDGTTDTRLWTTNTSSNPNVFIDGTLDFCGDLVELNSLTVTYENWLSKRCGSELQIWAYRNGKWTLAATSVHTEDIISETVSLGGVEAEKVRIFIPDVLSGGNCIAVREMSCAGYVLAGEESFEDKNSNVLSGKNNENVTLTGTSLHPSSAVGDFKYAFDGDLGTRYAVTDVVGAYSITIDLGDLTPLFTLSIYDFQSGDTATRSDKTKIELYMDGVWVPIVVDQPLVFGATHTDFNLYGLVASKIRITFCNSTGVKKSASIYEITCTTGATSSVDRSELLSEYEGIGNKDLASDFGYSEMRDSALDRFLPYLWNVKATQAEIDEYTAAVKAYADKLTAGFVTNAYGDVTKYNVGLEGNLIFKFYLELTSGILDTFADAYVLTELPDGTVERFYLKDMSVDSEGRYVVALDLAAAEMTEAAKLRLILDDANCGAYVERSIKTYAEAVIADEAMETAHPGITELLKSMLNYGGYAQNYFGHNTENLANEGLYDSASDPVLTQDITESAVLVKTGDLSGVKGMTWTLGLETEVAIKLFFTFDEDTAIGNYTFTLTTPAGDTVVLTPVYYGGRYLVQIPNVTSGYLDNDYTLVIKNGVDSTESTVTVSAMCYVGAVLSSTNEALVNLVKALKIYNNAANTYFGK